MRNTSWLLLFMAKDDAYGIAMALSIHKKHDEHWDNGWRIGLIDVHIDDDISTSYDRTFPCQLFALDNETKRAYSWEFTRPPNETWEWVQNKEYLNSPYNFKIPKTLFDSEIVKYKQW